MRKISESLASLDPTLVEAAGRATNKMQYQIGRLQKRAAQAELRRNEIIARHAAQIENALYPRKYCKSAKSQVFTSTPSMVPN